MPYKVRKLFASSDSVPCEQAPLAGILEGRGLNEGVQATDPTVALQQQVLVM